LDVTDKNGNVVVTINDNKFELGSPAAVWKSNRNDCAIEVIAPDGSVAMQAVFRDEAVIVAGVWGADCRIGRQPLKPLFQYPADESPGVLADE
jgi:hypothetical protein